jgi:hypothetical protein
MVVVDEGREDEEDRSEDEEQLSHAECLSGGINLRWTMRV